MLYTITQVYFTDTEFDEKTLELTVLDLDYAKSMARKFSKAENAIYTRIVDALTGEIMIEYKRDRLVYVAMDAITNPEF